MSLITNHINGIQPEPDFLCCMNTFCSYSPGILQIGVDHNHTNYCTQIRICAKYLRTAVSDQDRQECIRRITEKLCKCINRTACINVQESIVYHEVQCLHDAHQESAGYDRRNDRYENISKCLDQSLNRIRSGSCYFLQFFLTALADACDLDKFVINFIYHTGSQNDLHLSLCKENALYSFDILHIFFVCLRIICNNQAKTCGAVSSGNNVLFFSDMVIDFLSCLSVIHNILPLLCYRSHINIFVYFIYSFYLYHISAWDRSHILFSLYPRHFHL